MHSFIDLLDNLVIFSSVFFGSFVKKTFRDGNKKSGSFIECDREHSVGLGRQFFLAIVSRRTVQLAL